LDFKFLGFVLGKRVVRETLKLLKCSARFSDVWFSSTECGLTLSSIVSASRRFNLAFSSATARGLLFFDHLDDLSRMKSVLSHLFAPSKG
jgi:hypothetical protein